MSEKIKVALLGLGEIGQEFAENFLDIIQEAGKPVEIAAVAHDDPDSPIVLGFKHSNVPVFKDAADVIDMGENIDIIFDLTGNTETRQRLRQGLMKSDNKHTVIAPEIVAKLLWMFFDTDEVLSGGKGSGY